MYHRFRSQVESGTGFRRKEAVVRSAGFSVSASEAREQPEGDFPGFSPEREQGVTTPNVKNRTIRGLEREQDRSEWRKPRQVPRRIACRTSEQTA